MWMSFRKGKRRDCEEHESLDGVLDQCGVFGAVMLAFEGGGMGHFCYFFASDEGRRYFVAFDFVCVCVCEDKDVV
jgi:hypothetical protein